MFSIILLIAAIAIAIILTANSLGSVPPVHFAVRTVLGRRLTGCRDEGLHPKWPLIESWIIVSRKLGRIQVDTTFTVANNLQLRAIGDLHFRPDPTIEKNGRNVFVSISEDVFERGITKALEAQLGAIGGEIDAEQFINKRRAIADFLNCILRLETPPHLNHDKNTCGVVDCTHEEIVVESNAILSFYTSHFESVRKLLRNESKNIADFSSIEKLYGIDIEKIQLADVDFTTTTVAALEKKKQAEYLGEGFRRKLTLVRESVEVGLSPETAMNSIDLTLDTDNKVTKKVIATQGNATVVAVDGLNLGVSRRGDS